MVKYLIPQIILAKYLAFLNKHKTKNKIIPEIIFHGNILLYSSIALFAISLFEIKFFLLYIASHVMIVKYKYFELSNA